MPNLDGTGPRGEGPRTGRGMGNCTIPGQGVYSAGFGRGRGGVGRGLGRGRGNGCGMQRRNRFGRSQGE